MEKCCNIIYVSTSADECKHVAHLLIRWSKQQATFKWKKQSAPIVILDNVDSAAGSAKEARDRNTQAILPVRGKIKNVLKDDLAKALGNAEIQSMITAFGLEIKDNKVTLNEDKLRYGKIIIMADADVN